MCHDDSYAAANRKFGCKKIKILKNIRLTKKCGKKKNFSGPLKKHHTSNKIGCNKQINIAESPYAFSNSREG